MRRLAIFATAALVAGCSQDRSPLAPETSSPDASPALLAQQAVAGPDDHIVVFRPGVADPPGLARQLVAAHGGTLLHTYVRALQGFAATLPPQAVDALRNNPNVDYIEKDGEVWKTAVGSWGLDRIDQRALPLDGAYTPPSAGAGVTVYIIDTGVDYLTYSGSTEFGSRFLPGYDFVDDDSDAQDCDGHGTHVAGTVGSATYGVAKGVSLVGVRVLNCQGSGTYSYVIAGIDWVTANAPSDGGPSVANMSLGGGKSQSVNDAVNNSVASGVTYAVSAGNSNANACNYSPASAVRALTVASSTSGDARSSFSNWGSCVDLFAPGSGITSTVMGGGSESWSGTSMASPHVAGVAAMILTESGMNTPADVETAIKDRATRGVISGAAGSPNLLLYSGTDPACSPGTCPEVSVAWVSPISSKTTKGKVGSATVVVQVRQHGTENPAAGVVVNGSWDVNGNPDYVSSSGTTGADGKAELSTGGIRFATEFAFCVTSLTGEATDRTVYPICSPYGSELGGSDPGPDPPGGAPTGLTATSVQKGKTYKVELTWSGGGASVDVRRDGTVIASGINNDGSHTDNVGKNPTWPLTYEVCDPGTAECSDSVDANAP